MTNTFKVGDKVQHRTFGAGEVAFGPYRHATGDDYYLMQQDDGTHSQVVAEALTSDPIFSVGDTVAYEYGAGGKLVAGPFKSAHLDVPFWVVEQADGFHFSPTQNALTKVDEPVKVGDRVRVVRAKHAEETHGELGTVTSVTGTWTPVGDALHPYTVSLDNGGEIEVAEVTKVADVSNPFVYAGKTYVPNTTYTDVDGDSWTFELTADKAVSDRFSYNQGRELASVVDSHGPLTTD